MMSYNYFHRALTLILMPMNYRLKQLLIDRVDERQLCIRHG